MRLTKPPELWGTYFYDRGVVGGGHRPADWYSSGGHSRLLGGKSDYVISRLIEVMTAFPGLLFAILLMTLWGNGLLKVILVLGLFPTLLIALSMPGFSFVGDGLRDALDPRLIE